MAMNEPSVLYIGGQITIIPESRQLLCDGSPVELERRAFDVLHYLLTNRERVVSKDELLEQIWSARPVSESVVPQAITKARKALQTGGDEEWIATIHGVGYRLVHPLEEQLAGVGAPDARSMFRLTRNKVFGLITTVVLSSVVLFWPTPQPLSLSIAILPLRNETGDSTLDWAKLGVLPLMRQSLASPRLQRVNLGTMISTLRQFPGAVGSVQQAQVIRDSMGSDWVLEPVLTLSSDSYRLTLRTVGQDDQWSVSLDGQDVTLMAVTAGAQLSQHFGPSSEASGFVHKVITNDAFVNEAYARGMEAQLRGQWQDANRFLETVTAAAPDLHWANYQLSIVARRLGDWDRAAKVNAEVMQVAEEIGYAELLGATQGNAAILAWRQGEMVSAEIWNRKAAITFESIASWDSLASTWGNLGILAVSRGDIEAGTELLEKVRTYYEKKGHRRALAQVLTNLGVTATRNGKYEDAEAYLQQSLEIRKALGYKLDVSRTLSALADIQTSRGNWQEALAAQLRVLASGREYEDAVVETQALTDLSDISLALGQYQDAADYANQSLASAMERAHPPAEADASLSLARAYLRQARLARAQSLFARALAVHVQIDDPNGQFQDHLGLADLARLQRDHSIMALHIADARALLDDMGDEGLEIQWLAVSAQLAILRNDEPSAIASFQQALAVTNSPDVKRKRQEVMADYALFLFEKQPESVDLKDLLVDVEAQKSNIPEQFELLSLVYERQDDSSRALEAARRHKLLLGEGWTASQEARLNQLAKSP